MIKANNTPVDYQTLENSLGYKGTSDKYVPVSTKDVINMVRKEHNVSIAGFNQARVRDVEKHGFQRHAVMLEFNDAPSIDGTKMNLVIFNSGDRSSSLKIYAGAVRAVCSNSLVWTDGEILEPLSIKHTRQDWKTPIHDLIKEFDEMQEKTTEMINRMMSKYMSGGDMYRFTERAVREVLNPIIEGKVIDHTSLNVAVRVDDLGKNLWNTFNRVQSYVVNGGIPRIIESIDGNDKALTERVSKTHKITDSSKVIKVNQQLHKLAVEFM